MNNRYLCVAVAVLAISVVAGSCGILLWMESLTIGPIDYTLIDCQVSSSVEDMNVTQGSTLHLNFNLTSKADQELTIPIENITLFWFYSESYDGELDTFFSITDWPNGYGYNHSTQDKVFNCTFSATQVVLQPLESDSIDITLEMADNAPVGKYSFLIALGNGQVTSQPECSFEVRVNNKLNEELSFQRERAIGCDFFGNSV